MKAKPTSHARRVDQVQQRSQAEQDRDRRAVERAAAAAAKRLPADPFRVIASRSHSSPSLGHNLIDLYATNQPSGVIPDDQPEGFRLVPAAQLSGQFNSIDVHVDVIPALSVVTFQAAPFVPLNWGIVTVRVTGRIVMVGGPVEMLIGLQRQQAPTGGASESDPQQLVRLTSTSPDIGNKFDVTLRYDDRVSSDVGGSAPTDRLQVFMQFEVDPHFPGQQADLQVIVNVRPTIAQKFGIVVEGDLPQ